MFHKTEEEQRWSHFLCRCVIRVKDWTGRFVDTILLRKRRMTEAVGNEINVSEQLDESDMDAEPVCYELFSSHSICR